MTTLRLSAVAGALALAVAPTLLPAQAPAAPSCSGPEYRQFDFWIGTWDVFGAQGALVGTSSVTLELNGCVLHEHWESVGAQQRGRSFNIYDRQSGRWHQSWVSSNGNLLLLNGSLRDGRMVLEGHSTRPGGVDVQNRITWSKEPDGSVRQLWEQSTDGGKTWSAGFDGRYVRR
jgi:hypothetical protein